MDIYTVLKSDNAKLERLLGKLGDTAAGLPDERRRLVAEVSELFRAHAEAEESSILPFLADDDEARGEVKRLRRQNRETAAMLEDLARTDPTERRFKSLVEELRGVVREQLEREEERLLPRASELIPSTDAVVFGRQVIDGRAAQRQ